MCGIARRKQPDFSAGLLPFILSSVALLFAGSASAADSQDVWQALGLDSEDVISSSLVTLSAVSSGSGVTCLVSNDNAIADGSSRTFRISTGLASDGGFQDTDFECSEQSGGAGGADLTRFAMMLDVPAGAQTLNLRTQFFTTEAFSDPSREDTAVLYLSRDGGSIESYDLTATDPLSDTDNPTVPRAIDVAGTNSIEVSVEVKDGVDGNRDSALEVSDVYFSEEPISEAVVELAPESYKLPVGTFQYSQTLISVPGVGIPFEFSIYYSSRSTRTGSLVQKWTHSYEWSLRKLDNGQLLITSGDGGAIFFSPVNTNRWVEKPYGVKASSRDARNAAGGEVVYSPGSIIISERYVYTAKNRMEYEFTPFAGSITNTGYLTEIRDPHGNKIQLNYKQAGPVGNWPPFEKYYLDTVVDTRGNVLQLFYQTDGFLRFGDIYVRKRLVNATYVDDTDAFISGAYPVYRPHDDCFNNQTMILGFVQDNSQETDFTYDCKGNLLTVTDPDGVVTHTNTFAGEKVSSQVDGKGAMEQFVYAEDVATTIDKRGLETRREFDLQSRLRKETDPTGAVAEYAYDDNGNVFSTTDPLGRVSISTYDARDNLATSTDPAGNVTTYGYDVYNNLTSATDPGGFTTIWAYDAQNRLLSETDALQQIEQYEYDARGQLTRVTDRRGGQTDYQYSPQGDQIAEIDPLGHMVSSEYDTLGRPVAFTDQNGNRMSIAYDVYGNLLSRTLPDGAIERFTYDGQGRVLTREAPNGAVTEYVYSATGKILSTTDALGNTFATTYTPVDQIATQTDELGRVTSFEYDAAGRQVMTIDALGNRVTASYDAAGNRTGVVDPKSAATQYEYDVNDRVVREVDPLGNTIVNSYDSRGLLSRVTNGRGQKADYVYDANGRLSNRNHAGYSIADEFLSNGLSAETRKVTPLGTDIVTRDFDLASQMTRRVDQFGNQIGYRYDPAGNITEITYSDGKTVAYGYDSRNRLTSVTDWDANTTSYEYDQAGNLVFATMPDGATLENEYDTLGRLIAVHEETADGHTIFSASYAYNAAGLRVSADETLPLRVQRAFGQATYSYDAANQISGWDGESFEYDADGNLVNGRIGGSTKSLAYDEESRLVTMGSDAYRYGPDGYRVESTIGGTTTRYVFDASAKSPRVLEEQDSNGNIIARYVYGLGLISRQDNAGYTSVYHYDSRGSTIALSSLQGTLTDRYAYSLYGELRAQEGSTPNPFKFIGRYGVRDDGNGLYFMTRRYYEPRLMRFIQKDRSVAGSIMNSQSLNLHSYVRGNPVTQVDPGGDIVLTTIAVGIGVGLATEVAWDYFIEGDSDLRNGDIGPYLENNAVDLIVAGALGAWSGARTGAKAAKHADDIARIGVSGAMHAAKKFKKFRGFSKAYKKLSPVGKKIRKYRSKVFQRGATKGRAALKTARRTLTTVTGISKATSDFVLETAGLDDEADAVEAWMGDKLKSAGSKIGSGAKKAWNAVKSLF